MMEQEPMEFSCPVNMNSPHNPDAFLSDIDTIPETDDDDVTRQDNEGGSDFIFQQVESLDNLFVEHGRDKPPKFINERYLLGSQLGQGSYGKVKQVLDTFTLQKLAVKIMNKQKLKKIPNGEQNALNEFRIMRKLSHKNVVAVYQLLHREAEMITSPEGEGESQNADNPANHPTTQYVGATSTYKKPEKLYLLMEYCVCGLYDLLENAPDKKLPTWQAHKYFCDLIDGIEYLHSQRVIHKDIKPQNLLLSPNETLKISDFGVAEELSLYASDATIKSSAGTPMFQPPEVAAGKASFCGFKLDVWCAGITLYNIVTGSYPFEGQNLYLLLDNISKQSVHVPVDLSPQLQSLLKFMLEKNPRDRFGVAQVKTHRWVVQKHCITPERVYMPNSVPHDLPYSRCNSVDFVSSRRQTRSGTLTSHKNTLPLPYNTSAASFNYFDSGPRQHSTSHGGLDFISSLEKIFNLADSEVGHRKMETEDLMHVAGGGSQHTNNPHSELNSKIHDTKSSPQSHKTKDNTADSPRRPYQQQHHAKNGSNEPSKSKRDPRLPRVPNSSTNESLKPTPKSKKQCSLM